MMSLSPNPPESQLPSISTQATLCPTPDVISSWTPRNADNLPHSLTLHSHHCIPQAACSLNLNLVFLTTLPLTPCLRHSCHTCHCLIQVPDPFTPLLSHPASISSSPLLPPRSARSKCFCTSRTPYPFPAVPASTVFTSCLCGISPSCTKRMFVFSIHSCLLRNHCKYRWAPRSFNPGLSLFRSPRWLFRDFTAFLSPFKDNLLTFQPKNLLSPCIWSLGTISRPQRAQSEVFFIFL